MVDAQARYCQILILFHLGFYDVIHCTFAVIQNNGVAARVLRHVLL